MKTRKMFSVVGCICLVLVLAALLFPACAAEAPAPVPTPTPTPTPIPALTPTKEKAAFPNPLLTGAYQIGTTTNAMMCAIAPVMEDWFKVKVRVSAYETTRGAVDAVGAGKIHMYAASVSELYYGVTARESMAEGDGPYPLNIIWTQGCTPWAWAVREDSPIKSVYDIKGKRVAEAQYSPGMILMVDALLDFVGLTRDDVVVIPVSTYTANVKSIAEGKADIAWFSPISGVTREVAAGPHGLRWLALPFEDTEGWEKLMEWRSVYIPGIIETGVEPAHGLESALMWYFHSCSADFVDEDTAYQLTEFFDKAFPQYKDKHNYAPLFMTKKAMRGYLDQASYPVHRGAIKYLKETGLWTAEDDDWNKQAIEGQEKYEEAWAKATGEAKAKGIKVDIKSDEWMELWNQHIKDLSRFPARLK